MSALGLALAVVSALRVPGPLSPRAASYRIEATLDAAAHTLDGREHLTWRNTTDAPAAELVLHLYWNAFKNETSTFLRESGGHRRGETPRHWGWIDVTRAVVGGAPVALTVDDTLATLHLPAPVAPGASVEVDLDWRSTLPDLVARAGWHDDFVAVAQWFPKVGVFDAGRWRAAQYHQNSEFFADWGVYDVTLDVPAGLVVGATGVVTAEERRGARKVLHLHAEDVHDFAWFASPDFERHEEVVHDALGDLRVVLLSPPGHASFVPRHLAAARTALAELGRWFAPFPYAQLTIVDVPPGGGDAGGMEYPTLVTTDSFPAPRGLHVPELETIHEITHQYFYGMVGSDEVEDAWLDEGLTDTVTDHILERTWGAGGLYSLCGHQLDYAEAHRLGYRRVARLDPIATPSYQFVDGTSYGAQSYSHTLVLLRTVEALMGAPAFEQALARYFAATRFTHPRRGELLAAFAGVSEFLSRALDRADVVDGQVWSVSAERAHTAGGRFDADGGAPITREPGPADGPWHSVVVVARAGGLAVPTDVRLVFEDGSERRERWDDPLGAPPPGPRWRRFEADGPSPIAWAEVDPDRRVRLDVNRLNNGLRREPDAAPRHTLTGRWVRAVSALLSAVGF